MNEHKISLNDLFKRLDSSKEGLSSKDFQSRLGKYGLNILETKKKLTSLYKFLKQFTNFFAILLIIGSGLAFFAEYLSPDQGNLYIAIALAAVVILNAIFTFIQEYQSEKIMESFSKMLPINIKVFRNGNLIEVPAKYIVPGDIIYLNAGDKIAADGRLIEQNALKVDNSPLTGESEPQLRKLECTHENILESRNMIFSGTTVQSGSGKAIVYSTGMNTQIGKIATLTKKTKTVLSPLQKEIRYFIKIISGIAIFLGITFFIISLFLGHQKIASLIFAIGIIVANVPEGLLPTVTLSLTMTSKRMAKKNALIKNLDSVETLGSTTVICTDKTGTITQNKMAINKIFIDMQEKDATSYQNENKSKAFNELIKVFVLCNNARLKDEYTYIGDPTEGSLLLFAKNFADIGNLNNKNPRIHESPFDSSTKRMITTNRVGSKKTSYLKGAPEIVIEKSSKILVNNIIKPFTDKQKKEVKEKYEEFASKGIRVLALGYKETITDKVLESNFVFLGLAGMSDPARPEVPEALSKCKEAGIKVIMITGDHSLTAQSIAREVGLIEGVAHVVLGRELEKMTDEELQEALEKKNILFARTSPLHKLRIVQVLQNIGHIVTVTGDGVNDAPALKNSDMGVAMGINGTEVAKEASNMVLLDDNFATIVNAIEEGRTIFENIKKFVAYILTSNIPEILPFLAFVLIKIPPALTVVLILAIDLGTDLLPALGLGKETPESDVMKRPPRSKKERLLTPNLLFMSYGIVGMLQAAAGFFSFFVILIRGGWTWGQNLAFNSPLYIKGVTAFFVSVVICQIADVLICRTRRRSVFEKGLFSNRLILLGIFSELLIIAFISYVPAANTFFGTSPLSLFEISLSIPFALLILFGDELRKVFVRRNNTFITKYFNW